ncbi:MAG TPA: hypothetical protein VFD00_06655 [Thermoclostridium sp.]|nr:hypothetical protein [Thermoclostridium sp.]
MGKLHGKSVLLGVGIGVILTALIALVFSIGYRPELDKDKVKELARGYGMVDLKDVNKPLRIEIKEGDTITHIAKQLAEKGLIQDEVSFQIKVVNRNLKEQIKTGIFELNGDESEDVIIEIITQ